MHDEPLTAGITNMDPPEIATTERKSEEIYTNGVGSIRKRRWFREP